MTAITSEPRTPDVTSESAPATGDARRAVSVLIPYDGSPGVRRALRRAAPLLGGHRGVIVTLWWSIQPMSGMACAALPAWMVSLGARRLDEESRQAAQRLADEGVALAREHGIDACPLVIRAVGARTPNIVAVAADQGVDAVLVDKPCGLVARALQGRRRTRASSRPYVIAA